MKTLAALTCLVGLLAAIPAHAAESKDILGRKVPIGRGRPAVVLYANRGTRAELRETAYRFAYGLRDAEMRALFLGQGQQPPTDLEASFFMVADTQGEPHEAIGLKKGFDRVVAQAVSSSGQEMARGPFPQAANVIGRALGVGGGAPSPQVARVP